MTLISVAFTPCRDSGRRIPAPHWIMYLVWKIERVLKGLPNMTKKSQHRVQFKYLWHILQRHKAENLQHIFPEKELRGLSSNFHIHVSVRDLYIPWIGLTIFCCSASYFTCQICFLYSLQMAKNENTMLLRDSLSWERNSMQYKGTTYSYMYIVQY